MVLLPPANVVCEGYVFTHVCHSVHRGGHAWLLLGGVDGCSGGACVVAWGVGACVVALGGHAWLLWGACVVALGGHGWSLWGAWVVAPGGCAWLFQGGHVWLLPRGHAWDTMRYGDTANERAVRILLECILVTGAFLTRTVMRINTRNPDQGTVSSFMEMTTVSLQVDRYLKGMTVV